MATLDSYPLFQEAYFVTDLEKSIHRWNELFAAGPFILVPHHKTDRFTYRGTSQEADVSYAFGYLGDIMIQFIQQHDDTPSIYREMYADGEEGYHHVATLVHDFPAERQRLLDLGYEIACELYADGVDAAYFDTRADHRWLHRDPRRPAPHPGGLRQLAPGPRALPPRRPGHHPPAPLAGSSPFSGGLVVRSLGLASSSRRCAARRWRFPRRRRRWMRRGVWPPCLSLGTFLGSRVLSGRRMIHPCHAQPRRGSVCSRSALYAVLPVRGVASRRS